MPALLRAITAAEWCPSWPMWAQRGPRWTHPRAIGGAQAVRTPHMSRLVTARHAERRHRRHAEPTARGHGQRTVASRDCQARRAPGSAAAGAARTPHTSYFVTVRHAEQRGHFTRRRPDGPAAAVGPRRPPAAGESAGQLTHDHGALRQQPPAGRPRRGRIRATVAAHGPIIAGRLAAPGGCRGAFR